MAAAIEFDAVSKTYPGAAAASVHDVSLSFAPGTFAVVLGPSGCGKSTLLRMVAGLEEISAGTLLLDGRRANALEPKDRGCAMVFQTYALYPHMTVAQNIAYPLKVARMPRRERMERVRAVAGTLALAELLDRRPGQLSGGQRQRVAIGRAMVRSPRVFLFDEPLSNLDATLRVQMRAELRRLHDRLGVTSVMVTHDQVEAMTLADMVVIMRAGRVEQSGPPRAVYEQPATRFVAGFLGSPAMNLLDGRVAADGASLEVPGAPALPLPGRFRPGNAMTLGIRPEHVAEGEGTGPATVPAVCDLVEDLGTSRLLHARLGGAAGPTLLVHLPVERAPVRGERIGLRWPAHRLHLFDADGLRVAPAADTRPVLAA